MTRLFIKTILFILFQIIMTTLIPFLDFLFGVIYFNDILCDKNTLFKMPVWLIIKGNIAIVSTIFIYIIIISRKNSIYIRVSKNIVVISNIILSIWIFLGAVIFWHSCSYLEPLNVDVYIWFSILFGILYIANLKIALNFGDKIDDRPLLDV